MTTPDAKDRPRATELLADPRYYLFDTLPEQGRSRFLVTNERELAAATFVDIRYEPKATDDVLVGTQELVSLFGANPVERPSIGFVFHHAYVCSTLLARSLNELQAFISLKEPWILRRLAELKRRHAGTIPAEHWKMMVSTYVDLLAKQFKTGDTLIIKATNLANNLLYDVFCYWPERPVLYMHSDIQAFLVSNLKKNNETQAKMPGFLADFLKDSDLHTKIGDLQMPPTLSLLQTCALIWVANTYTLKVAAETYGAHQLRCLDMRTLLAHPEAATRSVSEHFGHEPGEHDVVRMTSKDIMGRNAEDKRQAYDGAIKFREDQQVLKAHRDEIEAVVEWVDPLVAKLGLYDFLQDRRIALHN